MDFSTQPIFFHYITCIKIFKDSETAQLPVEILESPHDKKRHNPDPGPGLWQIFGNI